ncbi:MAG: hypothetical protein ACJ762_01310 [Solirubrobacteraceae bacterium]
MLHNGRLPLAVHSLLEYVFGALLIAAPFLLTFDDDTATAVSIVLGVAVIAMAASTDWPLAAMRSIPIPFHLALDFALAALLVASPFIFGFSGDGEPTAFFIALGVLHLLVSLGTRYLHADEPATAVEAARFERDVRPAREEEPAPPPAPPVPRG